MTENTKSDDLVVGYELPAFSRTTDLGNWNRFAAVNDEFVHMHMDDDAGRAAGYPAAFGMGNLQWAYLHSALREWLGDNGEIRSLSCQFRSPNLKGQTVTARASVTDIERTSEETIVSLDIWTETEEGLQLAPGRSVVVLSDDGHFHQSQRSERCVTG
ncbi:MaoC/PaaZ C-terminal domain-containing protein [Rhodococcus sp. NPDC059968]|uniref:MaoC/PaaZ C-terminal domain-containing protein n=1 Tax=Rhodococcus sp. NPDC059968 TaxID=3347017 RepID=UPI0036704FED